LHTGRPRKAGPAVRVAKTRGSPQDRFKPQHWLPPKCQPITVLVVLEQHRYLLTNRATYRRRSLESRVFDIVHCGTQRLAPPPN